MFTKMVPVAQLVMLAVFLAYNINTVIQRINLV